MYGIVLAAALTSGTTAADWGFKHKGCYCAGCHCGCYCGCGCGCYGGYGCYGCGWCGGCHGCWTTCGCYGCHGYCGGWGCCSCSCGCYHGGYVSGACYGCYGCCTAICHGCAVPVVGGVIINGGAVAAPVMIGDEQVRATRAATVIVKASKDVQLKVNGQVAPRKSDEETYTSPALTPGRTYSYTFVAERTVDGQPVTETKEVTVYAGRSTVVDFSNFGKAAVAKTEAEAAPASVTVVLPENAKLTVNDVAVTAKGKQTFTTPKLEQGKSYFYTVKAEIVRDGKPVTETRRIDVAAGKDVTVDFTVNANLTASR
jgi:uncharacterized protein (TIGR03000 family)